MPSQPPATRRTVSSRALAVLAAAAVAPLVPLEDAEAATRRNRRRRHAARCRHWHRCPQHPRHTCRHLHRCAHRRHRAQPPAKPPTQPIPSPTPSPTTPTGPEPAPTAAALHLGNRFGYGMTPELYADMRAAGGPEAWFERQLDPAAVADPEGEATESWWVSNSLGAAELWARDQQKVEATWTAMSNYACWCLVRRIHSRRQVLEAMTEFWENHLHVPIHDDGVFAYRVDYGRTIRGHALGRYDDMLVGAITHPAMGISLDNASSTKRAPNENLGRELLELHTVGRGHHTEDDVKNSARILTGYRVKTWTATWDAYYDPASHWVGPVRVLGFSHPNGSTDGRPVAEAYLRYLARHPRTAERIARKLVRRFVTDDPAEALVAHLASVYLAHDTAIKPVLRELVASAEFRSAAGGKVRTPTDDVVATYRALGARLAAPTSSDSAANVILWQANDVGQQPFSWSRPDGQPEDNRSWSSASRLLASFAMHYSVAGGWWPKVDVTYRTAADWLPADSVRFDALVDHLSRTILGRAAPPRILTACIQATGTAADATITADHSVLGWKAPILLTTLLDTPEHLHR